MASGYPDWLRAFTMVGKHDTEYKPVLVDVDGNLYALLQGMTPDDDLRTVRLDDDGRMSAFIIDSTDAWNRMLTIGNAELAARLGSPVIYEQSGRVQFIETWDHGFGRWLHVPVGAGSTVAISPVRFRSGGYSALLTSDDAGNQYELIRYKQGAYVQGRVGLAFSLSFVSHFEQIEFRLYMYDGVDEHQIRGRINDANNKLEVYDSTRLWHEVAVVDPGFIDSRAFLSVKIVADILNDEFCTFSFNQEEHDISDHALWADTDPTLPNARIEILLWGREGENDQIYVDDIILTFAEP